MYSLTMKNHAISFHPMFRTENIVSVTLVSPTTRAMLSWNGFWGYVQAGGLVTLGRSRYTTRK
jgi:hypothetical protein